MNIHNRKALNILKGFGVVLPISISVVYLLGPFFVNHGQGLLIFALIIMFLNGVSGYIIGTVFTGRWLTVAGITGVFLFAAMAALLLYYFSQPVALPPKI